MPWEYIVFTVNPIAVSSTIREVMSLIWKISQIYDCFGEISFCILSQAQFERFLMFLWTIKSNNQEKNRVFFMRETSCLCVSFIKTGFYSDKEKINNLLRMVLIVLWYWKYFVEHNFKSPETNEVGCGYFSFLIFEGFFIIFSLSCHK